MLILYVLRGQELLSGLPVLRTRTQAKYWIKRASHKSGSYCFTITKLPLIGRNHENLTKPNRCAGNICVAVFCLVVLPPYSHKAAGKSLIFKEGS